MVAARALTIHEDDYLKDHTISLETQQELMGESIYAYVWNNFKDFVLKSRLLSDEDQELLFSYYVLGKTQTSLAIVNKSTQTICSSKIRMAIKRLGAYIILGDICEEVLDPLLEGIGRKYYDKDPLVKVSSLILLYAHHLSFQDVADTLQLYRPDVRRYLTNLAKDLVKQKEIKLLALGAHLQGLIDKSSSLGHGPSKARMISRGHMFRKDPDILGEFEVNLLDPEFKDVLYPRANQ